MNIVKLNIDEVNGCYSEAYHAEVLIKILDKNLIKNNTICNAFQKAYDEHYNSFGYTSIEDAINDGVCFGRDFSTIPPYITKKYGFEIIEPLEFTADYDNGFKSEE